MKVNGKKLNREEIIQFIKANNKGVLPKVGGGLNEEVGSDHYGYEITYVSDDFQIIRAKEIGSNLSSFYAALCVDGRCKKFGKYVDAAKCNSGEIKVFSNTSYWISENPRPTELDPSF